MNQEIIDEIQNQNYEEITKLMENFLKEQMEKTNSKGLILGLSGGIDSAVLAYLCKRQLKEKTLAIIMPDTEITPRKNTCNNYARY
jgi:NAD+ synthase